MHDRYQDRFSKLKEQRQYADDQYQKEHQKRLKAQSQIDSAKQLVKDAQSSADQRVQSMTQLSSEIKANASQLQQEELKVANKYYSKQSSSDVLLIPLTKINWKTSDIDDGGLLSDDDSQQKIVDSIELKDPYTGKSSTINYQNDGTVDSVSGAWGVITDIANSSHTDDLLKLSRDGRLYKNTSRKIKVNDQRLDGQRLNLLVSRPAGSDRDAPWVVQRVKFVHDKGGIKP